MGRRPIRLKFWQRTYLITLALFLVCLFGGIFGVTTINRELSFNARCEEFLSRQHSICLMLAEDISAVSASRPAAIPDLFSYYGSRYKAEGIGLIIWQPVAAAQGTDPAAPAETAEPDGTSTYGRSFGANVSQELFAAESLTVQTLQPGSRSWQVRVPGGRHTITATTAFTGSLAGYAVTCTDDIEPFFAEWQRSTGLFFGLAAGVSALFAAALYFVLRQLYRPLQNLTSTAASLAASDFSARADARRSDEFGDLARTLNEMAAQVSAQLQALSAEAQNKQQLVDNLSHEMRTPLAAIGGYAEYIQRASLDPAAMQEATETIRFESRRLLNLSDQLVSLSALTHEGPAQQTLDAAALLRRALKAVAPKAQARGVTAALLPLPAQPVAVQGSADLLESLLVNLADNGIKATPRGGTVTLALGTNAAGHAVFTVADSGCGMDAETLAHIGQPFYRADKARSRAEGGAGLGVALCNAIAAAHGAALRYQSTPGQGTVATVEF